MEVKYLALGGLMLRPTLCDVRGAEGAEPGSGAFMASTAIHNKSSSACVSIPKYFANSMTYKGHVSCASAAHLLPLLRVFEHHRRMFVFALRLISLPKEALARQRAQQPSYFDFARPTLLSFHFNAFQSALKLKVC